MAGSIDTILEELGQTPTADIDFGEAPAVNEEQGGCDKTGTTDDGVFKVANIRRAIALGTAAINLANAYRMAQLQEDIADKYASIAEKYRKHYLDEYKPLEIQNIEEVKKLPKYDRSKESLVRGQMLMSVRDKFGRQLEDTLSCSGRYCTGVRAAATNRVLTEQAASEAAVAGLAHRYIDNAEIVHNEHRWERRRGVLNIGRDIPAEAVGQAQLSAGIFGSIGAQSAKAAEGGIWAYRFETNRRDTIYNKDRPPMEYREREINLRDQPINITKPRSVYKAKAKDTNLKVVVEPIERKQEPAKEKTEPTVEPKG